jgi:hypothetical protein
VAVIPIVDAARNVSKRSVASEQSSSSKYDDALGRRAKVMIGKSQDRLHRHGIFSISHGIRDLVHSGGNGVSTPVNPTH